MAVGEGSVIDSSYTSIVAGGGYHFSTVIIVFVSTVTVQSPFGIAGCIATAITIVTKIHQLRLPVTIKVTYHITRRKRVIFDVGSSIAHLSKPVSGRAHPVGMCFREFTPATGNVTLLFIHGFGYHHIRFTVEIEVINITVKPLIMIIAIFVCKTLIVNIQCASLRFCESSITIVQGKIPFTIIGIIHQDIHQPIAVEIAGAYHIYVVNIGTCGSFSIRECSFSYPVTLIPKNDISSIVYYHQILQSVTVQVRYEYFIRRGRHC